MSFTPCSMPLKTLLLQRMPRGRRVRLRDDLWQNGTLVWFFQGPHQPSEACFSLAKRPVFCMEPPVPFHWEDTSASWAASASCRLRCQAIHPPWDHQDSEAATPWGQVKASTLGVKDGLREGEFLGFHLPPGVP